MLSSTRKAPHLWLLPIAGDLGRRLGAIVIHQIAVAPMQPTLAQASACVQIDLPNERRLW
jgi:hypothetical protein